MDFFPSDDVEKFRGSKGSIVRIHVSENNANCVLKLGQDVSKRFPSSLSPTSANEARNASTMLTFVMIPDIISILRSAVQFGTFILTLLYLKGEQRNIFLLQYLCIGTAFYIGPVRSGQL